MAAEPTVLISARTPVGLSDAFRAVAAARGQTLSQALRACVEHAVIEAASSLNDEAPTSRASATSHADPRRRRTKVHGSLSTGTPDQDKPLRLIVDPDSGEHLFVGGSGRVAAAEFEDVVADPRDATFDGECRLTRRNMARDRQHEARYRLTEARRFGVLRRRPGAPRSLGVRGPRRGATAPRRRAGRPSGGSRGDPDPGEPEPPRAVRAAS